MMNLEQFFSASTWILPVSIAVIMHELAHGYVAFKLGDDTAAKQGRLSLNPIKHVDLLGTIVFPIFLIIVKSPFIYGWAKPVPVSIFKLKKPKIYMALVAAAGPITNIIMAFIAAFAFKMFIIKEVPETLFNKWIFLNIANFFAINLILAAFNLIPLPPLDGSKVLAGFLPNNLAAKMIMLEKQGMLILIALIFLPSFINDFTGIDVNILGWYVDGLRRLLANFMISGLGI